MAGLRWVVLIAGLLVTSFVGVGLGILLRGSAEAWRNKELELLAAQTALFDEKQKARVTLKRIGDAVITTDAQERVRFMNPIAERLTGWSAEEARTLPLSGVLQMVDEWTRKPLPGPTAQGLFAGEMLTLPQSGLVLSRQGNVCPVQVSMAAIRDQNGQVLGMALILNDASSTRRLLSQMAYQASHDSLTGLVNRGELEVRLAKLLKDARSSAHRHALCHLDLDHFKVVNDSLGHAAGDELLKELTSLLSSFVGNEDTLARIGGDEFGLLLNRCSLPDAIQRAQVLINAVRSYRFAWGDKKFEVGASVGVVAIAADSEGCAEVLAQADIACYSAKETGGNRVYVYNRNDEDLTRRREAMLRATELMSALEAGRFRLFGQPIFALAEGGSSQPAFFEILLRLEDSDGSLLYPNAFIPAAEKFGLMAAIDRWVVRTSLYQFAQSEAAFSGCRLSINLSGNSLADPLFLDYVYEEIEASEAHAESICFEITETAVIRSLKQAIRFMKKLKTLGCTFALDDFGSGLSSFSYLRQLPVNYLKIDGEFVRDMTEDSSKQAMVGAIHEVSRVMGLDTIAECVTSMETADRLRAMGVEYGQGYGLGRPAPLDQLLAANAAESPPARLAQSA